MQLAIKTHLLERFLAKLKKKVSRFLNAHLDSLSYKKFRKGVPPCTRSSSVHWDYPGGSLGIHSHALRPELQDRRRTAGQRESNPMSPARQAIRLATVLLVAQRLTSFNS
ncbi:hypothetical protein T03_1835 [Trichinella britovi]|uniref:Uncharacterized protein n=1 Tax=Trichinella britovi TaxID=45882 RepID=A0A0V1DCU2_TRIBR|nr:hypothetical protein T03_1835 [Trichinella britovi]